jgi:2-dehydro-3-deoxyphosphooctonate aldolase (KDO 8-P synthase)
MTQLSLGPQTWNWRETFLLIAGPCVIENTALCRHIAATVAEICGRLGVTYVFKASFDKANRSGAGSFRGQGMERGLDVLAEIHQSLRLAVTTDVHETDQVAAVAEVVDIVQIPAFLCRQTDLILAAGRSGKAVNVKKGQFMAPWEMANVVEKLRSTGNQQILLTERGTFFGYNRLVNDMTAIVQMQALGTPVLFDATHSTQLPGGLGKASGGQRQYVEVLAAAATAAGADGLFIEVHPEPEKSPSDAATILPLDQLELLLIRCLAVRQAVRDARKASENNP